MISKLLKKCAQQHVGQNTSPYPIVFLTKILLMCNHFNFFSPSALHYQAAADFAKAHLPEALRQQLLTYERERERDREKDKEKDEKKERGGQSYRSILEQQILTLDREMLDKLSATYNEAGVCVCILKTLKKIYTYSFNIHMYACNKGLHVFVFVPA